MLIVLGGLSLFMIQMVGSVLLYLEYPVTVNTRIVYNKTVTFPAVTICNQNVFRYPAFIIKITNFLRCRLKLSELSQRVTESM